MQCRNLQSTKIKIYQLYCYRKVIVLLKISITFLEKNKLKLHLLFLSIILCGYNNIFQQSRQSKNSWFIEWVNTRKNLYFRCLLGTIYSVIYSFKYVYTHTAGSLYLTIIHKALIWYNFDKTVDTKF